MIICCGEALIDMLPGTLETGEDIFIPTPGGAIFNTAIALSRLGEKTGFISGISNDFFGDLLIKTMETSGVVTDYCIRNDQPSTLAFLKLVKGNAEYSFFDEMSAGRQIGLTDIPDLPDDLEALHFGAISLIPEPCGTTYETLALKQSATKVISLDPNIRRGLIKNTTSHRARISMLSAIADIIKLSDEDLKWIADSHDHEKQIQSWLDQSTSIVIITHGREDAHIFTRHHQFTNPSIPVDVVDTVGAGDSFNAGLLAGLKRAGVLHKKALKQIDKDTLQKAVQLATKVASITVSRAGANPPWQQEID